MRTDRRYTEGTRVEARLCAVCSAAIRYEAKRCCSRQCAMMLGRMTKPLMQSPEWPEERIDRLRLMWGEGLTVSVIAERLRATRNAIVGKVHRLQLTARPSPIKRDGPPKPRVPRPPQRVKYKSQPMFNMGAFRPAIELVRKPPPPTPRREPRPPSAPYSPFKTCQFPLNDDMRHPQFCGEAVYPGRPYCEAHCRRCYQPWPPVRRDLAWAA